MKRGLLALIFFILILQFQNGGFCEEMGQFKEEILAVKGTVINIHPNLPLGPKQEPYLVIAVRADTLIYRDREEKQPEAIIWLLRISEDKKGLFKEYKIGDSIVAYGVRKSEARVLDVIDKGLGDLKKGEY